MTGLFVTLLWHRYWQCQDFFRGLEVGGFLQAAETKQIFPNPAAQSFLTKGSKHRFFGHQATLVPATPAWEICGPGNLT